MTDWPTTPYTYLNMPSCMDTAAGPFTASQRNILSTPMHMFPLESFSSRTLPISTSGNCRHSSMFHCSCIHKWSLVVCGFGIALSYHKTLACTYILRSACELFVRCSVRRIYHIHGPCEWLTRIHSYCECIVHFRHEYTYCTMNIVHLITVLDLQRNKESNKMLSTFAHS